MVKRRPIHILQEIGDRLTAAREALQLKQNEFCTKIGVATNTYNQWEKGKTLIDPLAAARLKEMYGITTDWIYTGDPSGLPHRIASKIPNLKLSYSPKEI